jgi:hypothetical protein
MKANVQASDERKTKKRADGSAFRRKEDTKCVSVDGWEDDARKEKDGKLR